MRASGRRSRLLAAGVALASAMLAAGATAGSGLSFFGAKRAYQGKPYAVSVSGTQRTACTLAVRYADGAAQAGLGAAQVVGGKATWRWTVPEVAAPGRATLTARCGAAKAQRRITVVGTIIPPRIVVVKSGFSVRERQLGSTASYGILLKNTSPNANALKVSVQVNFVLADSRLIGTATQSIPLINAGSTYNHAGSLSFPGGAPIKKLELVILIGAREKTQPVPSPALDNVVAVPQTFEPSWTAWVQGEVINNQRVQMLKNVQLSAVLFDAAGNVLGGATGGAYNRLPPGTRQVFKLTNGVDAVPYNRVASVAISTIPTWETSAP